MPDYERFEKECQIFIDEFLSKVNESYVELFTYMINDKQGKSVAFVYIHGYLEGTLATKLEYDKARNIDYHEIRIIRKLLMKNSQLIWDKLSKTA